MMDLVLGYYSLYVTLLKCSDVPEVLEVQEVPFLTYWYVSGRMESDCEELVGLLTGNGVGLGAKSSDSTYFTLCFV